MSRVYESLQIIKLPMALFIEVDFGQKHNFSWDISVVRIVNFVLWKRKSWDYPIISLFRVDHDMKFQLNKFLRCNLLVHISIHSYTRTLWHPYITSTSSPLSSSLCCLCHLLPITCRRCRGRLCRRYRRHAKSLARAKG